PLGAAPSLVMAQQTSAPAIGLAGTWTGNLSAALGTGGVVLIRAPSGSELDKILPAAPPPYTPPVALSRGQVWAEGRPLEMAWHWTWTASATAMRFLSTTGPIPDLLVSDGPRALLLRPGNAQITGVGEDRSPPRALPLVVSVSPNPAGERTEISVFHPTASSASGSMEVRIYDLQGRTLRRARVLSDSGVFARWTWDGRDDRGRRVGSGRYWLRVRAGAREGTKTVLILR
ncbi:MAG TPA: FlgD immunoglobulin-like domain containing protein, partial [Candidatus Polarisedimenticolia bacterium]|nr:FlgD immunoglobulin-like domain containing protein [Candidatus Polarisedimenticolia bacterium]